MNISNEGTHLLPPYKLLLLFEKFNHFVYLLL